MSHTDQNSSLSTMSHTDQNSSLSTMSHTDDDVLQGKLAESAASFVALFTRDKDRRLRATVNKLRELAVALSCSCPKTRRTGRKLPSLCVAVGGAVLGAGVGALTGAMGGAWGGVVVAACDKLLTDATGGPCGGVVAKAFDNIFTGAMAAACGGVVAAACDKMLDGVDAVDAIHGVFGSVVGGAAGGAAVGAVGGVIGGALVSSGGGSVRWYYHTALGAAGCLTGGAIGAVFGDAVGGAGGAMGGAFGALCGAQLATGAVLVVAGPPVDLRAEAAEASHVEMKEVRIAQEFQETIDPLVKELEVVKTTCESFRDPGATVQGVARRSRSALAAVDSMKRTLAECTAGSTKHQDTLAAARFERSARQCTQTIEELERIREDLGHFMASIKSQI